MCSVCVCVCVCVVLSMCIVIIIAYHSQIAFQWVPTIATIARWLFGTCWQVYHLTARGPAITVHMYVCTVGSFKVQGVCVCVHVHVCMCAILSVCACVCVCVVCMVCVCVCVCVRVYA